MTRPLDDETLQRLIALRIQIPREAGALRLAASGLDGRTPGLAPHLYAAARLLEEAREHVRCAVLLGSAEEGA